MKSKVVIGFLVFAWWILAGNAFGGTEEYANTFYGLQAGNHNTGNWNTFLGFAAGYANTTGEVNTFIGSYAGNANTTGFNNVFLGYFAGYANTTGAYNNFLGNGAGNSNTTGTGNNFIGNFAGNANTTGDDNNFVGKYAGFSNATGNWNNFIGDCAGYSNTTGYGNDFSGFQAGFNNTTGIYNNFIGYQTGYKNTTGYGNNFLGFYAGYKNTTGYNNTFLGYQVGYNNTTGAGNVFLGYKSGFNETGSNKLYIANSNTATPLIYGEFNNKILRINGNVGIGRAPSYPIHTAGGAYVTTGGVWTNASSREYKTNIKALSTREAFQTLAGLKPVKFVYKADRTEQHIGFIAEDVPELVATKDRKGLSAMDIVTVLTKVVQEQQDVIRQQQARISAISKKVSELEQLLKSKGD